MISFYVLLCNRFRSLLCCVSFFFFFKQKTAYEMRISDWSSDVCSSDLYRFGKPGESEEDFATRMAESLEALILREGPDTVAAFIAEPEIGRASCRERVCQYV